MGPEIISSHFHKTPEDTIYHQYINIMSKSIIDDETGESLEYRHLIKHDKHKNKWVKYFSNELGRLTQGLGDIVKCSNTIFLLLHDRIPTYRRKDITYGL